MKSRAFIVVHLLVGLNAIMGWADGDSDLSGKYSIVKVENTGYPANHSDFIHVLKWNNGSDVAIKFDGTNAITVIFQTKYSTLYTNALSYRSGYSIRRQDGTLIALSNTRARGYMLPGSVTVEKEFRFHLNPERVLVVESSYSEKGRAFGVLPWHDEPDRQVLHLKRK